MSLKKKAEKVKKYQQETNPTSLSCGGAVDLTLAW